MNSKKLSKQNGFTLIELLVVIGVIGALAGVLLNVIDTQKQRENAEDSVSRKDINDIASAIEAYRTAEGSYPDQGTVNDPLDSSATTNGVAAIYINEWPTDMYYQTNGTDFSVHIQKAADMSYIKYNSIWREIRECADTTTLTSITACD